ncbi:MAG TPA: hypothetical protein VI454_11605, partial [Verrucomicrobiae bacterium]
VKDLAATGEKLKAGDLISLGSFARPEPPKAGQTVTVRYDGLPGDPLAVSVSFSANTGARATREPVGGLLFYEGYTFRDNTGAVNNPHILGPLFQLYWSEIEKKPGEFDWREWDRRLEPWLKAGKKFALRIMWCSSGNWPHPASRTPTPQWVWDAGAKHATYELNGTEIPLFWDPIYKRHARRFMEEVARKFDADERLLFVDVTPGAETNPYRFRVFNAWRPQFKEEYARVPASDGRTYSDELWLATVKESIDASAAIFRRAPLLVTLNVAGMSGDRFAEVSEYCVARGFYVGQNGLSPTNPRPGTKRGDAFLGWAKETRLFFEMVDATGDTLNTLMKRWGKPPVPGAKDEPDTSTLLDYVKSAEAMQCRYLNVYPEDVLKGTRGMATFDPAWEAALQRGAAALEGKR